MKLKLFTVAFLVFASAGATADLFACGAKFLVASRGTRFGRVAIARAPAAVLVLARPSSVFSQALDDVNVAEVLGRAGYRPTVVSDEAAFERALAQGGWHIVVTDLDHGAALRGRLSGDDAPMIVPVLFRPSRDVARQAERDYGQVIAGPVKSQRFLETVDEAVVAVVRARATADADA